MITSDERYERADNGRGPAGSHPYELPDDPGELHARVLGAVQRAGQAQFELARLLWHAKERRVHRAHGYATVVDYGTDALGLAPAVTRALVRVGRALSQSARLSAACRSGEITWTKARELVRVLTPENEAAWLATAAGTSSRELEQLVGRAQRGEPPPSERPEPKRRRLSFLVDPAEAATIERAIARFRAEQGLDKDACDDGAVLARIVRQALSGGDETGLGSVDDAPADAVADEAAPRELPSEAPVAPAHAARPMSPSRGADLARLVQRGVRQLVGAGSVPCLIPECTNPRAGGRRWRWNGSRPRHRPRALRPLLCASHQLAAAEGRLELEWSGPGTVAIRTPDAAYSVRVDARDQPIVPRGRQRGRHVYPDLPVEEPILIEEPTPAPEASAATAGQGASMPSHVAGAGNSSGGVRSERGSPPIAEAERSSAGPGRGRPREGAPTRSGALSSVGAGDAGATRPWSGQGGSTRDRPRHDPPCASAGSGSVRAHPVTTSPPSRSHGPTGARVEVTRGGQ